MILLKYRNKRFKELGKSSPVCTCLGKQVRLLTSLCYRKTNGCKSNTCYVHKKQDCKLYLQSWVHKGSESLSCLFRFPFQKKTPKRLNFLGVMLNKECWITIECSYTIVYPIYDLVYSIYTHANSSTYLWKNLNKLLSFWKNT